MSRVTLFSITCEPDELALIDFVDFETTLALSLVVAGRWEEKPKKNLERFLMTFSGMSVFDVFSFQVTCERRLSHARNVNILHAQDASCLVLVTLDFS